MFEEGTLVVYGNSGVCKVVGFTHMDMAGVDRKRLYYVLQPQYGQGTVYTPTDSQKAVIRPILTEQEAMELIQKIPKIETLWIENEKQRELCYKEAIRKYDCEEWVKIIKTLYLRKKERVNRGKKITSVDEKYWKLAEDLLYGELACSLKIERDQVEKFIADKINEMNTSL
ncbi:MAG: CarD family transcriptional regulator [Candidatus Limivivens sp.]|nr:CarD family transcriptional regulator [Candidatus Limivivens sp.]